jgi:putative nucleotidyltransferase with HDIG domain
MPGSAGLIVVIDDEDSITRYLSAVLTLEGYDCKCFRESLSALSYLSRAPAVPDLVMTDIRMPEIDGLEILRRVHALNPDVPVILISGAYDLAIAVEAVQAGAADYLFKPVKPGEVLAVVARHVRAVRASEIAAVRQAVSNFISQYKPPAGAALSDPHIDQTTELFRAFGSKRYETMQHSLRVASYAALLGEHYGLSASQLHHLRLGALLHDIGKIAIPRNVLLKPGPLNEREWEVMRTHPRIGFELLAPLLEIEEAAQIVYAHHENFDGTGYPRRLRGAAIPLGARLFSIVDAVDAITCNRPYRPARELQAAYGELRKCKGSQFDPVLVDLFLSLPQQELLSIRNRLPDVEELSDASQPDRHSLPKAAAS